MSRFLCAFLAVAALTLFSIATPEPAEAGYYRGGYGYRGYGYRPYYGGGYYSPAYYGGYSPAYYGGYDDGCYVRRYRVFDDWGGWYVRRRVVCY